MGWGPEVIEWPLLFFFDMKIHTKMRQTHSLTETEIVQCVDMNIWSFVFFLILVLLSLHLKDKVLLLVSEF